MKKTLPFILAATIIFVAGCKKDTPQNPQGGTDPLSKQFGGGPSIPSGAAGALYAVNNAAIDAYGDTAQIGSAYAWFGNSTTTVDAGMVSCNGQELSTTIPFSSFSYPWYLNFGISTGGGADFIQFNSDSAFWNVTGNSSTNVPPITVAENTPFVKPSFNVPTTVSVTSSLTINFSVSGSNDGIVATISGSKGRVDKSLASTTTSVTFTSTEVSSAAIAGGDALSIQIMPLKLTSKTISGKLYYFSKQYALSKLSTTN